MKPGIKIEGVAPLLRRIEAIKKSAKNKAERRMVTKGSVPIVKKAKNNAPKRLKHGGVKTVGTMKKSVGKRIRRNKKDNTYIAVIGPRGNSQFRRQIGARIGHGRRDRVVKVGLLRGIAGRIIGAQTKVTRTQPGDPIMHDPARIAHLVEKGHGGPHAAAAHAFMEPALRDGAPEAQRIMQDVCWQELQKAR